MMAPNASEPMVMVVDDEPMIRRMIASALTTSGYRVVDAETPEQAIRMMDAHPALDLLVTDVVMPEVDGCELAERMRLKQPRLKVLFISGFEPENGRKKLEQGSDFLQKPFRINDLLDRVGRMLAGKITGDGIAGVTTA
jgi:two-component system cell cycle sensor histidine kinase/response regulator CckA